MTSGNFKEGRMKMEISFNGGRFVSLKDQLNYQEALNDFPNAKMVRVVTFNISKNEKYDNLISMGLIPRPLGRNMGFGACPEVHTFDSVVYILHSR